MHAFLLLLILLTDCIKHRTSCFSISPLAPVSVGKAAGHVTCLLDTLTPQSPLRLTQLSLTAADLPQNGDITLSKYEPITL